METNTSQNSVATYEGVVGPFITTLLQIYTESSNGRILNWPKYAHEFDV